MQEGCFLSLKLSKGLEKEVGYLVLKLGETSQREGICAWGIMDLCYWVHSKQVETFLVVKAIKKYRHEAKTLYLK